jgi:heat shock protein HslJ
MRTIIALTTFFAASLAAIAMAASAAPPFALPATFSGVQPCADCPGIRTTLQLAAAGTYKFTLHYLERQVPDVTYTGPWSYDKAKSQLVLSSKMGAPQLLDVVDAKTLRALDRSGKQPSPRAPNDLKLLALDSNEWTLVELHGVKVDKSSTAHPVTLTFVATTHRASGSTGCNNFNGTYTQSGDKLTFSPLATTRMACMTGSNVESSYLKALAQAQTYSFDKGLLNLYALGQPVARFAPTSP